MSNESWHRATKVFRLMPKPKAVRFGTNGRWAVVDRPPSVLAPGTALRLHLCRALSSVRAESIMVICR